MEELKLFIRRSSLWIFVSRPTEGGISPINELLYSSRFYRLGIRLTESRMLPENKLLARLRSFNLERLVIFGDRGPWKPLLVRLRYSSLTKLVNNDSGIWPVKVF